MNAFRGRQEGLKGEKLCYLTFSFPFGRTDKSGIRRRRTGPRLVPLARDIMGCFRNNTRMFNDNSNREAKQRELPV
jgi:hypothetical protein